MVVPVGAHSHALNAGTEGPALTIDLEERRRNADSGAGIASMFAVGADPVVNRRSVLPLGQDQITFPSSSSSPAMSLQPEQSPSDAVHSSGPSSSSSYRLPAPLRPYRSQPLHPTTFFTDSSELSSSFDPSCGPASGLDGGRRYRPGQPLSRLRSRSGESVPTLENGRPPIGLLRPKHRISNSAFGSGSGSSSDLDVRDRRVIGYADDPGLGVDSMEAFGIEGAGSPFGPDVLPDAAGPRIRPRMVRTPPIESVSGSLLGLDGVESFPTNGVQHSATPALISGSASRLKGTGRDLGGGDGGDVLDLGEQDGWEEEYKRRAERGTSSLDMDPSARYHRHQSPRETPLDPTSQSLRSFFASGSLPFHLPEQQATIPVPTATPRPGAGRRYIGNEEVDSAGFGQFAFGKSVSPPQTSQRNMPSSWPGLIALPKRSPSGSSVLSVGEGRGVILTPTTQEWRELRLDNPDDRRDGEGARDEHTYAEQTTDGDDSDPLDDGQIYKRSSWGSDKSDGVGSRTQGLSENGTALAGHRRSRSATVASLERTHRSIEETGWNDGVKADLGLPCYSRETSNGRSVFGHGAISPDALRDESESRTMSRDGSRSAPPQLEEKDLFAALFAVQRAQAQESKGTDSDGPKFDLNALGLSKSTIHVVESMLPSSLLNRSQSVRVTSEPEKRKEKERDRLFRMVGEDIEMHGIEAPASSWGVKQVGSGWALDYIPPAKEARQINPGKEDIHRSGNLVNGHSGAELPKRPSGLAAPVPVRLSSTSPIAPSPLSHVANMEEQAMRASQGSARPRSRKPTRQHPRSRRPSYVQADHPEALPADSSAPLSPITSRRRQSQRLSMLAGRTPQPFAFPAALPPSGPTGQKKLTGLSSFSPFHSSPPKKGVAPAMESLVPVILPPHLQQIGRSDSVISIAPSVGAPSPSGTPVGETTIGAGGHGINDYSIVSEAGRGAYGMVKRARQLSTLTNEPFGDEVIIKYIIKSRILADCWKKHKLLGPIPIEIHVMDQLRNVTYKPPLGPLPWDPLRPKTIGKPRLRRAGDHTPTNASPAYSPTSSMDTPLAEKNALEWTARISFDTIRDRGHPNVCKMLDFFEDKEFYYLVMPRFGVGLDLFDRIESAPNGLDSFDIRSLLGQLSDALRFLHANGIVHRDIKDENVILDGDGHCQLIDFGSAAHWRPYRKWDTFSGTLDYASPEILRGEMYSGKEQDVWALGIVAFVLVAGETPFLSADEAQNGFEVGSKARLGLSERCCGPRGEEGLEADGGGQMKDAMDFIERCCEPDPENRPSADQLVMHRFVVGNAGWIGHRGWQEETAEVLTSPMM